MQTYELKSELRAEQRVVLEDLDEVEVGVLKLGLKLENDTIDLWVDA